MFVHYHILQLPILFPTIHLYFNEKTFYHILFNIWLTYISSINMKIFEQIREGFTRKVPVAP
jgi:hypothetical protein